MTKTKTSMAEIREALREARQPDICYELRLMGTWEVHDTFISTDRQRVNEKRDEWLADTRMNRNLTISTYRWENGERYDEGYVTVY